MTTPLSLRPSYIPPSPSPHLSCSSISSGPQQGGSKRAGRSPIICIGKEGNMGALRPQKPLRLIRDGEVRGSGILYLTPTRYTVITRRLCVKVGSCVSHFNVSFITVWAKSQDSAHKPQFLKREENRSGSNRGPSAYQPSALPLGHTGHCYL